MILDSQNMSIEEAVNIARLDEQYQQSKFGIVEGAHDYDRAHTLAMFSTLRNLLNLSLLRLETPKDTRSLA